MSSPSQPVAAHQRRADRRARRGFWSDTGGRGRLGSIIALLIVAALVYGGMKLIPVRARAFQLDDAVREQVVLAAARRGRLTEAQIRMAILERAGELGLPVQEGNIRAEVRRESVSIRVDYSVPVEFPLGYGFDWHFESEHSGPIM